MCEQSADPDVNGPITSGIGLAYRGGAVQGGLEDLKIKNISPWSYPDVAVAGAAAAGAAAASAAASDATTAQAVVKSEAAAEAAAAEAAGAAAPAAAAPATATSGYTPSTKVG